MNDRLSIEMAEDAPLTPQTRAALALNSTHTERDLIALAAKNTHIVAVIDKPGRQQVHSAAMELKGARVAINNTAKAAREDATQFQKAVIAEAERLVLLVEPEETRLIGLRDAYDDEQAMIRAAAEQAERNRITAIHANIAEIRNLVLLVEPEETRLIGLRDAYDDEQAMIRAAAEQAERNRITAIHANIAEIRNLVLLVEPEETRLIGLRDAYDDEQAMIRAAAEQAERNRITAIHANIAEIRNFLMLAGQCRTAERIASLIEKVEAIQQAGYESFDEFAAEASTIAATTYDAMVKLHASKVQDEESAERAKAEQEAIRIAQAVESAKLAAERAAFAKEQAAFKAQQAAAAQAIEDAKPKVDPVQELEQSLQDFAAVIKQEAPLTIRQQFDKTFAIEVWSPSDVQILDALCVHFGKSERLVFERLSKGIDLAALELACFDEITA